MNQHERQRSSPSSRPRSGRPTRRSPALSRPSGARENEGLELIASENFVSPGGARGDGLGDDQQVRRGLPGQALLRRLRVRRRRRGAGRARGPSSCSAATTPTSSPTPAPRRTWPSTSPRCQPGDTIFGMDLSHGGHLTHGHPLNYSGKTFKVVPYGVAGTPRRSTTTPCASWPASTSRSSSSAAPPPTRASSTSRRSPTSPTRSARWSWPTSPTSPAWWRSGCTRRRCRHCEFVTTTTHKTLRGPRGGMVMCKAQLAEAIDKAVFPGVQGGPLMHVIAAKAVAFAEALDPEYKDYIEQVLAQRPGAVRRAAGARLDAWSPAAPTTTSC